MSSRTGRDPGPRTPQGPTFQRPFPPSLAPCHNFSTTTYCSLPFFCQPNTTSISAGRCASVAFLIIFFPSSGLLPPLLSSPPPCSSCLEDDSKCTKCTLLIFHRVLPAAELVPGEERKMLQRAASNAYSWWWASHIRTRQSKWLDSNLQDMEDRVKCILLLLGEEADSFAKRAEMYYQRRPEVISSVEEAYRAYRALAERYDHMSGELHKANHTVATAFPDQVQYSMLEEDDDSLPKAFTTVDPRKIHKSTVEGQR